MIEVRPAQLDDADGICDAHVGGWRAAYRGLFPDDYLDADEFDRSRRENWRRGTWIGATDRTVLSGLIKGHVLGFAHVGPENVDDGVPATGRGEVYGFYLNPDAW